MGRHIRRSLIQPFLLKEQATLNSGTACLGLFFSQVLKTINDRNNPFGQPVPIPHYPQSHFSPRLICSLNLSFQLVPVAFHPPAMYPCEKPGSISSQALGLLSSPLKSSLLQAGQVPLPEPLLQGQCARDQPSCWSSVNSLQVVGLCSYTTFSTDLLPSQSDPSPYLSDQYIIKGF